MTHDDMPDQVNDAAAAEVLERGLGRRGFVRAVATVGAAGALAAAPASPASADAAPSGAHRVRLPERVLQPGTGPIDGHHYLPSRVYEVLWGYLPRAQDRPVLTVRSGRTVTIDSLSHEGLLGNQGCDPVAWCAGQGVPRDQVLTQRHEVARSYARHLRDFDADGPHVATGPIAVTGAAPGDVLEVELLSALPRVPYGVISSRHGNDALSASFATGTGGIAPSETMPQTLDGRATRNPLRYGNVSVFTPIGRGARGVASGFLPVGKRGGHSSRSTRSPCSCRSPR